VIVRTELRRVAVVGTGAIGGSWVALALAHDLSVRASDPAPGAEARLRDQVAAQLADLLDGTDPDPHQLLEGLEFTGDPAAAVADADLVLEAGPERAELKRELFAALDEASDPDVLLASSSSGLGPSSFQDVCRHPERVVVTHPFNPPHLIPLVEVVGGRATGAEAVDAAMTVMRRLGRLPVRIRAELPGHVVNRLQAALWREAYDLVGRGAISVADLDTAVASGPGLRWALLGPIATQHLSGGAGGLAHVLDHLGPPMVEWWRDLGAPELTPQLVSTLVDGVTEELGGREAEVLAARDRALRELMENKRRLGLAPATDGPGR
jgi:carnitine 3-dehydrogenase